MYNKLLNIVNENVTEDVEVELENLASYNTVINDIEKFTSSTTDGTTEFLRDVKLEIQVEFLENILREITYSFLAELGYTEEGTERVIASTFCNDNLTIFYKGIGYYELDSTGVCYNLGAIIKNLSDKEIEEVKEAIAEREARDVEEGKDVAIINPTIEEMVAEDLATTTNYIIEGTGNE